MKVRHPAVAGQFYEGDQEALKRRISECFLHGLGPKKEPPCPEQASVKAVVSPHAGYMYSGPVAAHLYYLLSGMKAPDLIVILGPNHYGMGSGVAAPESDVWITPLGEADIDRATAKRLAEISGIVDLDDTAHKLEHSIEVQVPFLQYIYGKRLRILPICMLMQDKVTATEIGEALASVLKEVNSLVIASSDLTHYESQESASKKDHQLLETVEKLDVSAFYNTLGTLRVTACGYGPIAATMTLAKKSGASHGRLLKYATSGDVTGDLDAVVGYASVSFE